MLKLDNNSLLPTNVANIRLFEYAVSWGRTLGYSEKEECRASDYTCFIANLTQIDIGLTGSMLFDKGIRNGYGINWRARLMC